MSKRKILSCLLAACMGLGVATQAEAEQQHTFEIGKGACLLDGKPIVLKSAELHYPRIPAPYWRHRLKMCKSLGMNAVCLYVFWNLHEPEPGKFDFTGQKDVAAFCKIAQEEGLWVIVRPGPYVCAEWEMGGLPWWLLKHEGVTLRDDDEPYFLERVKIFEKEVGKQLAPLTIENGGPIIMVQVENEYGSYGEDKEYVGKIRDSLREVGFGKTTLFQCDWSSNFTKNGLDDLVWTLNFGTGADVDAQFKPLKALRPESPLMCSEFWSGWFDKWGAQHETRPADQMVKGIEDMMERGISFSLYMTHGGTSFGHWAGANAPGFAPDVTSYDYDAPIDEQGKATPKYYLLQKLLAKYADKKLPAMPKAIPTMALDTIRLTEYAPLESGIASRTKSKDTRTFEDMDMGWGIAEYETTLPAVDGNATIEIRDLHDYAVVYVDGKEVGRSNRVVGLQKMDIGKVKKGQKLRIVVEAMGRINFSRAIADKKGITEKVLLSSTIDGHEVSFELKNWEIALIPDDYKTVQTALTTGEKGKNVEKGKAGYYRGTFKAKKTDDTFINCSKLGKGQVYINGHAIGRYWSIGPQQTLYVPGCWLKKGENEIAIYDVTGPRDLKVWGQTKPELNMLQTETDPTAEISTGRKPNLRDKAVAAKGNLSEAKKTANGTKAIEMRGEKEGRYIAIEVASTAKGDRAAIAEIFATGSDGKRIDRDNWKIEYVSDQDNKSGNNTAVKTIDLQESTYWQAAKGAAAPHVIVIDMGKKQRVRTIEIQSRAEEGAPGSVEGYRVYVY